MKIAIAVLCLLTACSKAEQVMCYSGGKITYNKEVIVAYPKHGRQFRVRDSRTGKIEWLSSLDCWVMEL